MAIQLNFDYGAKRAAYARDKGEAEQPRRESPSRTTVTHSPRGSSNKNNGTFAFDECEAHALQPQPQLGLGVGFGLAPIPAGAAGATSFPLFSERGAELVTV